MDISYVQNGMCAKWHTKGLNAACIITGLRHSCPKANLFFILINNVSANLGMAYFVY